MHDDAIEGGARAHYREQRLRQSPRYKGLATRWSEEEANAVLIELIGFFGLADSHNIPPPPFGLPGEKDIDEGAMDALKLGVAYFVALAKREGRAFIAAVTAEAADIITRLSRELAQLKRERSMAELAQEAQTLDMGYPKDGHYVVDKATAEI